MTNHHTALAELEAAGVLTSRTPASKTPTDYLYAAASRALLAAARVLTAADQRGRRTPR